MIEVVSILAPLMGIWAALGLGARALGLAPSVKEGMRKVAELVAKECGIVKGNCQQVNTVYPIDDCQLKGLTDALMPFFGYLVLESASTNSDILQIIFRCSTPTVDMDVIELVFRNFLRDKFNLHADSPIFTGVFLNDGRLVLICALSENGKYWLQEQKNNQRSRQIQNDDDLIE